MFDLFFVLLPFVGAIVVYFAVRAILAVSFDRCPHCLSLIPPAARVCHRCGRDRREG